MFWTCFVLQDRAVFFEVVRESQSGTLPKRREKAKERIEKEGQQNKCEEVSLPWNASCTAKLKDVMQAGRDAFAWQHDRILSRQKKARISTSGSNRDKSLLGHYCGKSTAMRTHASNQATRPSTMASLASVCVDSNSTRIIEARVEGARSASFLKDKE